MARSAAQAPQPPTKAVVAARVDSMVRAYMAEKGPASMSVAITRGSDTLVLRAWGLPFSATGAGLEEVYVVDAHGTALRRVTQGTEGRR